MVPAVSDERDETVLACVVHFVAVQQGTLAEESQDSGRGWQGNDLEKLGNHQGIGSVETPLRMECPQGSGIV